MKSLSPNDPERFGPYRLLAELGRGAMGRVLLGFGPDGRTVAVKIVRDWLAEDDEFRARFRREVAASQQVSGPYTAAVLDADPDAPSPWLATEFLLGPTLRAAVDAAGPLPEDTVLRLTAGLASALVSIHRAGIIHRDLKPSNVILAADGPRVIDFGIAHAADRVGSDLTRTGGVIGTPGFMSPEQAESEPLTPASDMFSLGSVLVMAATGVSPFAGDSTRRTLNNVVRAEPDLSGVPERVRRIAAQCLVREPGDRPTPAEVVALVGPIAPTSRPWPDAVAALADKQRRELERLYDRTGEDTTLIDNGPTMVTDPARLTPVAPQPEALSAAPPDTRPVEGPNPTGRMPSSVKLATALLWIQAVLLAPLWAYYVKMAVWNGMLAANGWPLLGGGSFTLALFVIGGSAAAAATLRFRAPWPRSIGIGSSILAAVSIAALLFGSTVVLVLSPFMLGVPVAIIINLSRRQARSWFTEPLRALTASGPGQSRLVLKRRFFSALTAILAAVLTLTIALLVLNSVIDRNSWEGPLFGP